MSEPNTKCGNQEILRLSNLESNRLTRESIECALVLLMKEQPFAAISITQIVRRAGVSRTAYYRNYSSKEDILRSMIQEVATSTFEAMNSHDPAEQPFEFWLAMFEAVGPHADSYRVLLSAGFGEAILNQIHSQGLMSVPASDEESRYSAIFWNGAAYAVLTEWIKSEQPRSEREMAELCSRIMNLHPEERRQQEGESP
ncbi:hypothetical protein B9G55_07940 [Saccharibacillus sp. O16]|nr:hypothetical protein B9G55_07940 [Saccharibacillus sp. O16]